MRKIPHLLAWFIVAFVLPASAAVIYQDDFSGASNVGLNGLSPDIGGGTWTANSVIRANGDVFTQGDRTAYLPFSPQTGFIYTATIGVDFRNTATGTGSLQFGFGQTVATNIALTSFANISGHAFIRQDGSAQSRRAQNTAIASVPVGTYNDGTPAVDVITLVLDTTGTNWTFQAAINGNNLGSLYTFSSGNPAISYIIFGTNNTSGAVGTFSNFSLTSIPEPSALLFCLAGGGLFLLRRRRS